MSKPKPCDKGKIRNPETNRCVDKKGKIGKQLLKKIESGEIKVPTEKAKKGQVFNPSSGRYVSATGKTGKAILLAKKMTKEEKKEIMKHIADVKPPRTYVDLINGKSYEVPDYLTDDWKDFQTERDPILRLEKQKKWIKAIKKYNKEKEQTIYEREKARLQERKEIGETKKEKILPLVKEYEKMLKGWKEQPESSKKKEMIKFIEKRLKDLVNEKESKENDEKRKKELKELKKRVKEEAEKLKELEEYRMKMISGEEEEEGEEKKEKGKRMTKQDFEKLAKQINTKMIDTTIRKIHRLYPTVKLKDNDKTVMDVIVQLAYDEIGKTLNDKYIQELYDKFKKDIKKRLSLYIKENVGKEESPKKKDVVCDPDSGICYIKPKEEKKSKLKLSPKKKEIPPQPEEEEEETEEDLGEVMKDFNKKMLKYIKDNPPVDDDIKQYDNYFNKLLTQYSALQNLNDRQYDKISSDLWSFAIGQITKQRLLNKIKAKLLQIIDTLPDDSNKLEEFIYDYVRKRYFNDLQLISSNLGTGIYDVQKDIVEKLFTFIKNQKEEIPPPPPKEEKKSKLKLSPKKKEFEPKEDEYYYGNLSKVKLDYNKLVNIMAQGLAKYFDELDKVEHNVNEQYVRQNTSEILDRWFEHDANSNDYFDHLVPEDKFDKFVKDVLKRVL